MASAKKIIGGLGKVGERLFSKPVPSSSADNALPLVLPRANLSSKSINAEAERVARQMLGEHVTSGRPKETFNLAGRSMKESERVKGLDYVLKPTGTVAKEVPYSPKRGEVKVALPGDQTVSDKTLESLEGVPIDSPQQGGAYYGLGQKHLNDPEFWKSNETPAKGVQGKVDRLADYYEPDRVVGTHLAMGQASNNFAMHFADANLKAIDWSKAEPKKISVFDNIVAGGYVDQKGNRVTFPQWPGLADPEAALKVMSEDSNLRKWFNNRMKVPSITEPLGLPNGLDIQYAITEPRIRDMEINMTGLMTGEMKPKALVEAAGAPHNTYTHRILGEAQGSQEVLTPFSIDFPDAAAHIASTKRPADFTGTIQKVFPHQIVDDQYINQYNQYRDRIKQLTGKKDGGAIQDDDQELKAMIADHLDSQAHDQELRAMVDNHLAGGGAPKAIAKAFKKLFADDVLPMATRDANLQKFLAPSAEKRRMYHGSKEPNIKEFKTRKEMTDESMMTGHYADERDAVFLSPEPQFTKHFSQEGYTDTHQAPTTYPVHVQIEKPFDFDNPEHLEKVKETYLDMYHNPDSDLYDPHMLPSERSMAIHTFNKRVDNLPSDENNWARIENQDFQDVLKDLGFDSFYTRERGTKNLGVYEPNRIKSTIGNRGTYDINEADINKADGGSIGNLSKAAQENLAKLRELRGKIAPVADAWAAKQAEDANKYTRDIQPFKMPINKAAGGKMVKGAAKGFKKLFEDAPAGKIIEAPSLMLPSRLSDLKNTVRAQKGEYGARRVERAADEIPNLERMYQEEALKRVFTGDNARALMTMNPADFEKYSAPLDPRFMSEHSTRFTTSGERLGYPDYMESYLPNVGAFNDVPFLEINKKQQGSTAAPFISGHEGRHRNRVLAGKGETSGLVQLLPRAELREPFPRRSQEDYLDALKKELELTRNMVKPETYPDNFKQVDIKRPAIELPDIYAKGGIAHMGKGGKLVKGLSRVGSQLFGNADEVAPAIKGGTRKFGSDDGGLNIMKETGGNWLGGRLDKDLELLRRRTPSGKDPAEAIEKLKKDFPENADPYGVQRPEYVGGQIGRLQQDVALNKWVDSNLKNYVKKQMGTQDDPVRALAEQGVTHRKGLIEAYPDDAQNSLMEERRLAGMPEEGVAKSPLAKAWERASDEAINPRRAGDIQQAPERLVKMQEAEQAMKDARTALNQRFIEHLEANGFKPNEIDKLSRGMPYNEKAKMVGDEEFQKATVEYQATRLPLVESDAKKNLENPWISKVDPDTSVYNAYTGDLGFDHIMDVLRQDVAAGRIRPEQLNKVSITDAVRRTHEFDQEMAKRMAETQIKNTAGMPTHKEYPDQGFKWIQLSQPEELPKGWSQEASGAYVGPNGERTIVNPSYQSLNDALKYEGDTMGHCVGSYCDDVAEGNSKIYSLRDAKGEPHVTIEVGKNGLREQFFKLPQQEKEKINSTYKGWESKLGREPTPEEHDSQLYKIMSEMGYAPTEKITQIKGKGNAKPKEEYLPFVQDFVKSGQWSDVGDIRNTGLRPIETVPERTRFEEAGMTVPKYVSDADHEQLINEYNRLTKPPTDHDFMTKEYGFPPPAEGMAEGGGAFKKIQFMDKGGVTTSGGDFSSEDVGADSYFSDEFKRRLAGLKEDSKTQMEKEYKQLSRAGGKKDLALRVGAQLAGGLPDILNMGLEGVDYLQSKVPALSRPASVLDVANSKDRVPKFALSSENPWLGSERIMDSLKEAKLLGDNEYPFMELASNFAVPAGAAALIKGGKKTAKGVKAMTSKPQGGLSATAR